MATNSPGTTLNEDSVHGMDRNLPLVIRFRRLTTSSMVRPVPSTRSGQELGKITRFGLRQDLYHNGLTGASRPRIRGAVPVAPAIDLIFATQKTMMPRLKTNDRRGAQT